jgi:hypothetical protein
MNERGVTQLVNPFQTQPVNPFQTQPVNPFQAQPLNPFQAPAEQCAPQLAPLLRVTRMGSAA